MRGPKPSYPITLTDAEESLLASSSRGMATNVSVRGKPCCLSNKL